MGVPAAMVRRVTPRIVVRPLALLAVVLSSLLLIAGLLPPAAGGAPTASSVIADPLLVADSLRFDDALLADVAAYRGPRRIVALIGLLLSVAVPLGLARSIRRGRAVRTLRLAGTAPGVASASGVAVALVVVLTALVRLPLVAWSGVVQDGRWGFRTRSVPGWLLDHLVVVGGRAIGVGLLVWVVARVVLRRPDDWHHLLVLVAAALGPLLLLLHPLVVHPFLLPTGAIPEGPHRDAVIAVAARADVEVPILLGEASLRTTRRNAVATGLGPTARVVLHDTLLTLEPREVAAIAAHELAHLERNDPLRAVLAPVPAVALVATLVHRRLQRRGRPDVRLLASAAALVLALEAAATPVAAALSRVVEHRTDVRSVALTDDPEAHVTMLRAFVTDGLADPAPPRWSVLLWATHPTPTERILAVSGADAPSTR